MPPKSAIFTISYPRSASTQKDIDEFSQISPTPQYPTMPMQKIKIKNKKFREEAACSRRAVRWGGRTGILKYMQYRLI